MVKSQSLMVAALVTAVGGVGWVYQDEPVQTRPAVPKVANCRPVGVMVNAPIDMGGTEDEGMEDFPDLAFAGTFEQTRLAIRLDYPRGGIVELRGDHSVLDSFQDDLGADLRKEGAQFGPFEMMSQVSDDRRSVVFVVPSDRLPGPRATRLTASGTVALLVSNSNTEARSPVVSLAVGESIVAGPFTFRITRVGASEWNTGWSITLSTKQDLGGVRGFALIEADGTRVELSPSMSISGGGTWSQTLECERELESGALVIDYWESPRLAQLPFEVSAGLGLR